MTQILSEKFKKAKNDLYGSTTENSKNDDDNPGGGGARAYEVGRQAPTTPINHNPNLSSSAVIDTKPKLTSTRFARCPQ